MKNCVSLFKQDLQYSLLRRFQLQLLQRRATKVASAPLTTLGLMIIWELSWQSNGLSLILLRLQFSAHVCCHASLVTVRVISCAVSLVDTGHALT